MRYRHEVRVVMGEYGSLINGMDLGAGGRFDFMVTAFGILGWQSIVSGGHGGYTPELGAEHKS